ncbi:MAG: DUF4105 domain-containing protein [Nevskiaceae bacterium]
MRAAFVLVAGLFSATGHAAGDPAYLAELQQAARVAELSAHPYWHKLLHYKRNRILPGVTSSVDVAHFFLAAGGKADPAAELDATLASFFSDEPRHDEPPQCRVKGRYEWLKGKLQFDDARLPGQRCEYFDKWVAAMNPAGIALVFAANDLNSPATMYGHTLLRVDVAGAEGEPRLLAQAINYAAEVATEGANAAYIVQALVGGFYGQYSTYRYHERVRQYVRVNHRDLWEYPVRLTRPEMDRVMWHLWEMRDVGSDYLFFTENCAFMLLSLLDMANEELDLTAEFDDPIPFVIPVDTLRATRDAGVLEEPQLRPSMARTLSHRLGLLAPDAYDWVLDYAAGDAGLDDARFAGATARDRARLLEVAGDYLLFRQQAGNLVRELAMPRMRAALGARSALEERADFPPVPVPAVTPDRGHESSRLAVGVRSDKTDRAVVIRARGAYHDRLDPTAGFLPGGEIEFVDLALLVGDDKVRVGELKLVSVQTVAPWDRAFRPWLWQAQGGLRRYGLDNLAARPRRSIGAYADGGFGFAAGRNDLALAYLFAVAAVDGNPDLDQGYALAGGARAGVWLPWSNGFIQQLEGDFLEPLAGGADRQLQLRFSTQWQFSPRNGVRLLFTHGEQADAELRSGELRWQHYF